MSYLHDFFKLLYPQPCEACNDSLVKSEWVVCTRCLAALAHTGFHRDPGNRVAKIFWGRVKLEKATSFLYFKKGTRIQKLMHNLKYKGKKEVGPALGVCMGRELKQSGWTEEMDLIIPVPLHPLKQKRRGYNQSEQLGIGLSESSGLEFSGNILLRKSFTETQTKKSRIDRWENVSRVFDIRNPKRIEGKHILLVDDIITTGATLEACANVLLQHKDVKVSVATMACSF